MSDAWTCWSATVERRLARLDKIADAWFAKDAHGDAAIIGILGEALGRTSKELREEIRAEVNCLRIEAGLPLAKVIKPTVRRAAGTGRSW